MQNKKYHVTISSQAHDGMFELSDGRSWTPSAVTRRDAKDKPESRPRLQHQGLAYSLP